MSGPGPTPVERPIRSNARTGHRSQCRQPRQLTRKTLNSYSVSSTYDPARLDSSQFATHYQRRTFPAANASARCAHATTADHPHLPHLRQPLGGCATAGKQRTAQGAPRGPVPGAGRSGQPEGPYHADSHGVVGGPGSGTEGDPAGRNARLEVDRRSGYDSAPVRGVWSQPDALHRPEAPLPRPGGPARGRQLDVRIRPGRAGAAPRGRAARASGIGSLRFLRAGRRSSVQLPDRGCATSHRPDPASFVERDIPHRRRLVSSHDSHPKRLSHHQNRASFSLPEPERLSGETAPA